MTVSCLQGCIIPGIHADPERVTLILSLCQGVFMNQFIFRHILGHIFPQKKRISTIRGRRYQKGKLNAKKKIIFRSVSFADLFVELKDIQYSPQNRSKNKLVRENALTRAYFKVLFNCSYCHGNFENVKFYLSIKIFHQYIFHLPSFSL